VAKQNHDQKRSPDSVQALVSKGLLAQQAGNWKAALDHFRQAARVNPRYAPVYLLIGNALGRIDEWFEVVDNYQNALKVLPHFADAYNNLGIALLEVGRETDAITAFTKAAEINPNHANAHFNLGRLSAKFNEVEKAFSLFEKTIAIQPQHPYVYLELGALQERCGLLHQSAASYTRSMELDPTRTVRENLAAILTLIGDPRGIPQLEELVREQPSNAEAHWNLGMGLLFNGRYEQGWREYEWRTEIPRFYKRHHGFNQPRWRGQSLHGQTILLYGEQGHGDTLQFLRYIPLVVECGGRVVLEVLPLLKTLLHGFPGVAACIAPGDPKPPFSTYAPLMSLPHILGAEAIPPPISPLVPQLAKATSPTPDALKVGLAWAGQPSQKRDHLRSIPLAQFEPLLLVEGVEFSCLQMGPSRFGIEDSKRAFNFVADCANTPDFAELAAVIATLDLVITVDTAVAHLAGTMGKPLWILLPNAVDWRWGFGGISTDWYPTARLFRQSTPQDWTEAMAKVALELKKLAGR
jgi:tetratricopeptide (TPR) repeat protein